MTTKTIPNPSIYSLLPGIAGKFSQFLCTVAFMAFSGAVCAQSVERTFQSGKEAAGTPYSGIPSELGFSGNGNYLFRVHLNGRNYGTLQGANPETIKLEAGDYWNKFRIIEAQSHVNGVVFESKNRKIVRAGGEGFPNLAAWKSVGYKTGENIRITKISGLTDHGVQTMKIEWIEDYVPSTKKGDINVIVAIKGPGKVKYIATSAASNQAAFKAMKETNDSTELSVSAKAEASYSGIAVSGSMSVETSFKTSHSTKKLNENSGASEDKSGSEETVEYEIVKGSIAVRTATMQVMYDNVTKNHFLVMKDRGKVSEWSDIELNDASSVKTLVGYVLPNESAKTFLRGKLIVGESQKYKFPVLQLP